MGNGTETRVILLTSTVITTYKFIRSNRRHGSLILSKKFKKINGRLVISHSKNTQRLLDAGLNLQLYSYSEYLT